MPAPSAFTGLLRLPARAAVMVAVCGVAAGAQVPLGREASELNAHQALQALDRYLESWNSRDPKRWAASLHYPHIRPGPGAFELAQNAEQYASGVDFNQTLATGWHHSEWTMRRVLQVGTDKVHVAGSWLRYTADDRPITGSAITYIVTRDGEGWGVLSRFAAGPTGVEGEPAARNSAAARAAVDAYFAASNRHDEKAVLDAIHLPYVRIADRQVEVARSAADFSSGSEPGRLRTWFETRLDRAEVVQVSANGANLAVVYSRRDRGGAAFSSYEAVVLAVRRGEAWKVQAISTLGP